MLHPIRATGQLGPLLKQLRLDKNWTQGELGQRVGLSQERISAIEKNPESVSLDRLLTIMVALDAQFLIATADSPENKLPDRTKRPGQTGKETW
jgi:HTH-type transcriptional regulator / antitoxin HipB